MGDFFDDLRDLRRTTREARGAVREIGSAARQIDRTRGEVQGAINGHYGDEEFNRSGQRAYRQESRYYDARSRADDAREAYENRDEYRRDGRSHEGLPPQGNGSRRPIPKDEFRHTEVAPPPPPSPDRANPSSMTSPKDDVVNPVTPASPDVAVAAKPAEASATASSATTPAAEAASPAPQKLSRDETIALQTELSKLGLGDVLATSRTPSGIDGIVGDKTRKAFELAKQQLGTPDLTLEQLANPEAAQKFQVLVAQHLEASKTNAVAQTPAATNPPVVEADAPMQEAVRQALAGGLQPVITGGADTGGPQGTPLTPNAQPVQKNTGPSVS